MYCSRILLVLAVATTALAFKLPCSKKIASLVCSPIEIRSGSLSGLTDEQKLNKICPHALQVVKCVSAFGECDTKRENPFFNFYKVQESLLEQVCDKHNVARRDYFKVLKCYDQVTISEVAAGCGQLPYITPKDSAQERAVKCRGQRQYADCYYKNLGKFCDADAVHSASTVFRNSVLFFALEDPDCMYA